MSRGERVLCRIERISYFQVLHRVDASAVLHSAYRDSSRMLERDLDECLLHTHRSPLRLHVERDVAGELGGSSLRQQTLRQVSKTRYLACENAHRLTF